MGAKKARQGLRAVSIVLGVVGVALVIATAWLLYRPGGPLVSLPIAQKSQIGGPFNLVSHRGDMLSLGDLEGRPFAVFFGFTRCPEACPTTLWEMSEALKELGTEAEKLRVLFISVDPTRDTPEFLANYLQSFDPRIIGLTGSEEEIAQIGDAYRAFWRKVPTEDGDYTIDHTASVYMMDGSGQFVGTIFYGEQHETRMDKLRKLLAATPA